MLSRIGVFKRSHASPAETYEMLKFSICNTSVHYVITFFRHVGEVSNACLIDVAVAIQQSHGQMSHLFQA